MWGFLYPLIVGGAKLIKGIQDTIENEEFCKCYYENVLKFRNGNVGIIAFL